MTLLKLSVTGVCGPDIERKGFNYAARGANFLKGAASALLRGFASNPIDIEENTAGHLAAAKCWPQDGFSPRL